MRSLATMCIAALVPLASARAEVFQEGLDRSGTPQIIVTGKLSIDDGRQFDRQVDPLPRATVVLSGPGGSVLAAVMIGESIRRKGFTTLVPDGQSCASACALAWLAGRRREMGTGSRIGFHAAHDVRTGRETAPGNALVGAYLNKLGLPYSTVIYITNTPPHRITWLTASAVRRLGIEVNQRSAPSTLAYGGHTTSPRGAPRIPSADIWQSDGSALRLVVNGTDRTFYYEEPNASMVQLGVRKGTLFFQGERRGMRLKGTSYSFRAGCAPVAYKVTGLASQNGSEIVLRGSSPVIDAECRVNEYRETTSQLRSNTEQLRCERVQGSSAIECRGP